MSIEISSHNMPNHSIVMYHSLDISSKIIPPNCQPKISHQNISNKNCPQFLQDIFQQNKLSTKQFPCLLMAWIFSHSCTLSSSVVGVSSYWWQRAFHMTNRNTKCKLIFSRPDEDGVGGDGGGQAGWLRGAGVIWTPYHRVSELVTDPNIVVSNFLFFRVGISIKKIPVSDLFSPMASFSQWTSE